MGRGNGKQEAKEHKSFQDTGCSSRAESGRVTYSVTRGPPAFLPGKLMPVTTIPSPTGEKGCVGQASWLSIELRRGYFGGRFSK